MDGWMRKYRRQILVAVIIMISIPFIFWVAPMGGPGAGRTPEGEIIVSVGGVPVYDWQLIRELQSRANQGGERLSFSELDERGIADQALRDLVDMALLRYEQEQRTFKVNQRLLEEELRNSPMFHDENGEFSAESYNRWVQENRNMYWNDLYDNIQEDIARRVFLDQVMAGGNRVPDTLVEEELLANHTTFQVRYAQVTPPVEASDEAIAAHYEESMENYRLPDEKVAQFARISLQPDVPALAWDIVNEARAGGDFGALADAHSEFQNVPGGLQEWTAQRLAEPDHRLPIFGLGMGEVSDPIASPGGFFIYKIEDERENEATGEREVRYRQIYLRATLDEAERETRTAAAESLAEEARTRGSLSEAADALGYQVEQTGPFTRESVEIVGLPREDARQFRLGVIDQEPGAFAPVTGRSYVYVAEVISVEEGTIPPLEEVRERVREDVIARKKREAEYQESVEAYAERIQNEADSLAAARNLFPELDLEIFTSQELSRGDFIMENQAFLQARQLYDLLAEREIGAFAGPVRSFTGGVYFVELIGWTPPGEEDRETWAEEREEIRERLRDAMANELLHDYLEYTRQRRLFEEGVPVQYNQAAINRILERDRAPEAEEAPLEAVESPEDAAA